MPGAGSSSRSTPRGSTCGCACRRAGTRSRCRARARGRETQPRHGLRQSHRRTQRRGAHRQGQRAGAQCRAGDAEVARRQGGRGQADTRRILALKGVIEVTEEDEREEDRRAAEAAILDGFDKALAELVAMRREEGATLGRLLSARLARNRHARRARGSRPRPQGGSDQGAPCRTGGDAAVRLADASIATACTRKRSCSPAKPISARSSIVHLPCARRRSSSPTAGPSAAGSISGAGTQPRIEYAHRQGQQRRPHEYRPGIEKRGRAIPRTGAEPGVI